MSHSAPTSPRGFDGRPVAQVQPWRADGDSPEAFSASLFEMSRPIGESVSTGGPAPESRVFSPDDFASAKGRPRGTGERRKAIMRRTAVLTQGALRLQSLGLAASAGSRALPRKVTHEYSNEALALAASGYESLNFEEDSMTHRAVRASTTVKQKVTSERVMLLIIFALGLGMAAIREIIIVCEALLLHAMNEISNWAMWRVDGANGEQPSLALGYLAFVISRLVLVTLAALIVMWEPLSQHSGMPRIKSHLNGADITGYLTLRTLLSKMVAIIFVVSTSLPCGKDGPMVHIGACLATLLSQHDYWFMKHFPELKQPHALRTWVSMGAAAGMCAAFNAPMGGILYCFEDVSTHWNRTLSWRAFLCAMTVVVAARVFMELPRELCGDSQSFQCKAVKMHTFVYGLDFLADNDYLAVSDGGLFWYMILSVLGGLIGALYTATARMINTRRARFVYRHNSAMWPSKQRGFGLVGVVSLAEVLLLSFIAFSCYFLLPLVPQLYGGQGCTTIDSGLSFTTASSSVNDSSWRERSYDPNYGPKYVRYNCPEGQYNLLASLLQSGQEGILKHLYQRAEGSGYPADALLLALVCYFIIAVCMYGVRLPLDAFVPAMIIGALGGRLAGEMLHTHGQLIDGDERGTFALMGSAAVLAGVMRMPLTLSVILVEITQDVRAMPLVMMSLSIASAVADRFVVPIDDTMIQLQGLPYLHEEPPRILDDLVARDVMSPRVVTLPILCSVREALRVLHATSHNGYPVVRANHSMADRRDPTVCGLILRRQLMVLLHDRAWDLQPVDRGGTGRAVGNTSLRGELHRRYVASHVTWQELRDKPFDIRDETDLDCTIDLSAFMDPCPALVFGIQPLLKVYKSFNNMGHRHIVVVDRFLSAIGIVTRKDIIPELVERRLEANAAMWQMRQQELLRRREGYDGSPAPSMEVEGSQCSRHSESRWKNAAKKVTPKKVTEQSQSREMRSRTSRITLGALSMRPRGAYLRLTYATVIETSNTLVGAHELIAEIMRSSMKNNPAHRVSGMLFYDPRMHSTIQVLEGEEHTVRTLYRTILADRRHKGCVVLKEEHHSEQFALVTGISINPHLLTAHHQSAQPTPPGKTASRMSTASTSSASSSSIGSPNCSPNGGTPKSSFNPSCKDTAGGAIQPRRQTNFCAVPHSGGKGSVVPQPAQLLRLQYISTLAASSLADAHELLTDILAVTMPDNLAHSIGGITLFNPRDLGVRGLLEGPPDAVRAVWKTILEDPRRSKCELVSETLVDVASRAFSECWGLIQTETGHFKDLTELAHSLHPFHDRGAAAAAAAAIKRLADAAALHEHVAQEHAREQADATHHPAHHRRLQKAAHSVADLIQHSVGRLMHLEHHEHNGDRLPSTRRESRELSTRRLDSSRRKMESSRQNGTHVWEGVLRMNDLDA